MAKRYRADQERTALTVLALCGDSATEAVRRLRAQGISIPRRTLDDWKYTKADELEEIRREVIPQIHARLATEQEATAREATQAAREYVAQARQDLTDGKVKDSASGARNLETVAGIALDKLLPMRDRPTVITKHVHAVELFEELERILPPRKFDADSTATELPPAA